LKELNDKRDRLLVREQVTDINAGVASEDIKTKELSERYVNTISALASIKSQYDRYRDMQHQANIVDYPRRYPPVRQPRPIIQQLDQQISNYRLDYASLKMQGFGEEHPTVIAARSASTRPTRSAKRPSTVPCAKHSTHNVDQLLSQQLSLEATKKQVNEELDKVSQRKQDLTRLRIQLKDIEDEVKSKTEDRAAQDTRPQAARSPALQPRLRHAFVSSSRPRSPTPCPSPSGRS